MINGRCDASDDSYDVMIYLTGRGDEFLDVGEGQYKINLLSNIASYLSQGAARGYAYRNKVCEMYVVTYKLIFDLQAYACRIV